MKLIGLKQGRWAISPSQPQIIISKGENFDVPDEIAPRIIKSGMAEIAKASKAEKKAQGKPDENKMLTPDEENKKDGGGNELKALVKEVEGMTKDELAVFAKTNKIKIDVSDNKKEILETVLKEIRHVGK
jgi:hypothetical protein